VIFLDKGMFKEAEIEFARAISLDSEDPFTLNNMGKLLMLQGRIDEALKYLEKALSVKPDYAFAHYNMGKVYRERKEYASAIWHFFFSLKYEPDDVYAMNSLGRTFLLAGLPEQARDTFEKVLREKDAADPYAIFGLGETYEALEELEKALASYRKLKALPGVAKSLLEKADARIRTLQGR